MAIEITKEKALALLKKSVEIIDRLKTLGHDSPEFIKWERNTEVAIVRIFGENSRHLDEFKQISFSPMILTSDTSDSDYQKCYLEGLKMCRPLLESMIEEIQEYWVVDALAVSSDMQSFEVDDKTNLLRSSYLDKRLQIDIDETIKNNLPISFIMADIDYFKKFNDEHGHLIGDDVLKVVSSIINKTVGNKGRVIRFGGEEISIVLPNFDIQEVIAISERIRESIESYHFSIENKKTAKITISLGTATSIEQLDYKDLIKNADNALRVAKNEGRNKVSVYRDNQSLLDVHNIGKAYYEVEIDLRSHGEQVYFSLASDIPILRIWLELINKSDSELFLDRIKWEIWLGRFIKKGEESYGEKIKPKETKKDILVSSSLDITEASLITELKREEIGYTAFKGRAFIKINNKDFMQDFIMENIPYKLLTKSGIICFMP